MSPAIPVEAATLERLRSFGRPGMSDDDILQELMDTVERGRYVAEIHRKADHEEDWVELDEFDWED